MNEMSVREELRTYSKSDLTRIAVLATRKQYAAERALARLRGRFAVLMLASGGAGFVVAVMVLTWLVRR